MLVIIVSEYWEVVVGGAFRKQVITNCNAHRFNLPSWINTTAVSGLTITVGLLRSRTSLTVKLSITSKKLSSAIVISTGTTVVPRSNTSCLDSELKSGPEKEKQRRDMYAGYELYNPRITLYRSIV